MIDLTKLKNTYFGIRHGESQANVAGIIAAGVLARSGYGLTEFGKRQVKDSIEKWLDDGRLTNQTLIYTSPLMRAVDTAEVAAKVLGVADIQVDERLTERLFGSFEGQSHDAYKEIIWPADIRQKESDHGVETTDNVKNRVLGLIEELEEKVDAQHILLVSHGDVLQILEACFREMSPSEHRSLPPLQNAEIRQYN